MSRRVDREKFRAAYRGARSYRSQWGLWAEPPTMDDALYLAFEALGINCPTGHGLGPAMFALDGAADNRARYARTRDHYFSTMARKELAYAAAHREAKERAVRIAENTHIWGPYGTTAA